MSFHFFHINEVYSNADGTVQFIEFVGDANGQDLWDGHTITSTGAPNYTVDGNLPSSSTLNKSVLVATQGFADLGLVTPDYIIPDGFLSVSGGTLTFVGMDSITFGALPGGTQSINGNGVVGTNSPTNFAGNSASIPGNPIVGTAAANTLNGTAAADYMVAIGGNDNLSGLGGNDTVNGGTGNDIVNGGPGNDVLIGGVGIDTATYQTGSTAGVKVNLALTAAQATGGAGTDTLSSIERATGSGFADKLTGSNTHNILNGLGGGDTLSGRAGNDSLTGGTGADKFLFNSALNASTNVDRITDFNAVDVIQLDNDIFTALATGALPAGAFRSGANVTTAGDAGDRIIYNTTTGNLYYDADGMTGAAAKLFATLTTHPAITAADFFIIA